MRLLFAAIAAVAAHRIQEVLDIQDVQDTGRPRKPKFVPEVMELGEVTPLSQFAVTEGSVLFPHAVVQKGETMTIEVQEKKPGPLIVQPASYRITMTAKNGVPLPKEIPIAELGGHSMNVLSPTVNIVWSLRAPRIKGTKAVWSRRGKVLTRMVAQPGHRIETTTITEPLVAFGRTDILNAGVYYTMATEKRKRMRQQHLQRQRMQRPPMQRQQGFALGEMDGQVNETGSQLPAPAGQNSGYPAGQNGGYPTGQNGGYPAGQNGGYPAGQNGGYPAGQNGGYPAGQNGYGYPARRMGGQVGELGGQSVFIVTKGACYGNKCIENAVLTANGTVGAYDFKFYMPNVEEPVAELETIAAKLNIWTGRSNRYRITMKEGCDPLLIAHLTAFINSKKQRKRGDR